MKKERKKLGLWLLPIGAVFLFNPTIGVIDILPDCIGYCLFWFGLRDIADLNYHMEESLIHFKRMIAVSAVQFLSVFWLFGFCSPRERPDALLAFSFTFSVLEIIFLCKAYSAMFEGFLYLGSRTDATAVFAAPRKKAKSSYTDSMAKTTLFFVVMKAILAVLPEFSALVNDSYDSSSRLQFLYNHISLLRTFAVIAMLPVSIVWLVKFLRYISLVLKDKPFIDALTDQYRAEILPKKEIFLQRAIHFGTVILSIGICFSLDIYIDYISFFPDFLCPLILLIGFFALKPYIGKERLFIPFALANVVTSAAVFIYSIRFYDNYTMSLTTLSDAAYNAYIIFCILKIVDSLSFLFMMLFLIPALRNIVENYTGFAPSDSPNFHSEDKIRFVHETLNKRLRSLLVLVVLCATTSILYILLVRSVNFMWIIEFLAYLILAIRFIGTLRAISTEVEYKYLLS